MDKSLTDGTGPGKHFVAARRGSGTRPATEFQGNGLNGRLKKSLATENRCSNAQSRCIGTDADGIPKNHWDAT
jgi:hypothetical protein